MRIGNRSVSRHHMPFVVAEMSCNHMGDFGRACALIQAAKASGADAVKIQIFDPDLIAEQRGGASHVIQGGPWEGMLLGEIYQKAYTPIEWVPDLIRTADSAGIQIFCTVFHPEHVEDLEKMRNFDGGWPAWKVSSFNARDRKLIRRLADTGKPVIVSVGLEDNASSVWSDLADLAVASCYNVAVMHCVSQYPADVENMDMQRIGWLCDRFHHVGLSDHSVEYSAVAPVVAVSHGACIVEKHLMLQRSDDTLDKAFSLVPSQFSIVVGSVRAAWRMLQAPAVAESPYKGLQVVTEIENAGGTG